VNETTLTETARRRLAETSTATLTSQLFRRGLRNTFVQGVFRLTAGGGRMVGEAYTLRYIPAREDLDVVGVFDERAHPQRVAVESAPPGSVLVMDARRNTRSGTAGSILVTRMMVRGVAGLVTDGGLRDSPEIETLDMPVYCAARSAPMNLTCHHAVDVNVPIGCGGVAVFPGDVIVGDAEGVVVIPRALAEEVARDGYSQTLMERFTLEEIRAGRSIYGVYPPDAETLRRFESWKKDRSIPDLE
jgi:regulator of RNase E activity RraA